jgi:hypothetical protein
LRGARVSRHREYATGVERRPVAIIKHGETQRAIVVRRQAGPDTGPCHAIPPGNASAFETRHGADGAPDVEGGATPVVVNVHREHPLIEDHVPDGRPTETVPASDGAGEQASCPAEAPASEQHFVTVLFVQGERLDLVARATAHRVPTRFTGLGAGGRNHRQRPGTHCSTCHDRLHKSLAGTGRQNRVTVHEERPVVGIMGIPGRSG